MSHNMLHRSKSYGDDELPQGAIPRSNSFCSTEISELLTNDPAPGPITPYFLAVCRSDTPQIAMTKAFQENKDKESAYYLSDEELGMYRVDIRDGVFYHGNQALTGQYIFTLMPNNTLYAAPVANVEHHSYLSQGKEVKGTGMLYCCNGHLVTVSNESGHYKPSDEEIKYTLKWFYEQNNNSPYIFEDHAHLNSEMLFDGIRYYNMECHDKVIFSKRIGLHELLAALKKRLKDISDKLLEQNSMRQHSASTSASSSEESVGEASRKLSTVGLTDMDPYEDTITQITPIIPSAQSTAKLSLKNEILNSALIYYTCLNIFKNDSAKLDKEGKPLLHSRFQGKPRKK